MVSGEEDLEWLCLGNNLDSTLEQGDSDLLCPGGVLEVTLLGLGEDEPEWLRLSEVTAFILGCGDVPSWLCLGDVPDFPSGSGDNPEQLCLCGDADCSFAWGPVVDPCLGGVPDFTLG